MDRSPSSPTGPLRGIRVLELVGLGPGPFTGMVLADLGADVLQVDRPDTRPTGLGALNRGKRAISLDLKSDAGRDAFLALVEHADVVIDVFRPGVAERLGIGPDECATRNPRIVFARLTGWGQDGTWSERAGHDVNYLALSGVLDLLGRAGGPPTPPINLLADFAGGALYCVIGITSALIERESSGMGQTIDVAMVDGAAHLAAPFFAGRANGGWGPRGTNMLDGAAPFYDVYECADGLWLSVGAIEPQFYAALIAGLDCGLDAATQWDQATWPETKAAIAATIRTRTRDEWTDVFGPIDACVAPVLTAVEAPSSPHAVSRRSFIAGDQGLPEPVPAPRLSRTPGRAGPPLREAADDAADIAAWSGDTGLASRVTGERR